MNNQEVYEILKEERERYMKAPEVNGCEMIPDERFERTGCTRRPSRQS